MKAGAERDEGAAPEIGSVLEGVFRSVLRISDHEDIAEVSTETHGEWDSITHINLVLAVEQEFRVTFSPKEVAAATSFPAMLALVRHRISA